MQAKYQRYYDALKGKDFSSPISGYNNAISTSKSKMDTAQSIINSSVWVEKGLEIIKSSVFPSLNSQVQNIESGLSALSTVAGKVNELISCLDVIKECDKELDSLGGKWTYTEDGSATESEVNSHNNKIDELNRKITEQENKADSIISAINAITVTNTASATSASFSTIMTDLKENTSLESKKQEFLGSLDDDSWWVDPSYSTKAKELLCFDNTTGDIIKEGDTIYLKPGETRILTVRVPHNAGRVKQVIRTTAWKPSGTNVVSTLSDINPDPNVVEYVNYKSNRNVWPSDLSVLETTSYDWIITANREGTVSISQTCEYKVHDNGGTPKAMIDINVNVSS